MVQQSKKSVLWALAFSEMLGASRQKTQLLHITIDLNRAVSSVVHQAERMYLVRYDGPRALVSLQTAALPLHNQRTFEYNRSHL